MKASIEFTAIDFETATNDRMPCQIGIVVVKNSTIVEKYSCLIQPPDNKYSEYCTRVHGIKARHTENSPSFPEVWKEIKHYFEAKLIVAHNASFDLDVLDKALKYYHIEPPRLAATQCTCNIFDRMDLKSACCACEIEQGRHHSAIHDAEACAKLFLHYLNRGNEEIACSAPQHDEEYYDSSVEVIEKEYIHLLPNITMHRGKCYLITGTSAFDREDLKRTLESIGASVKKQISKLVDVVIYGDDAGPAKMEKVREMQESGHHITTIDMTEFVFELRRSVKSST